MGGVAWNSRTRAVFLHNRPFHLEPLVLDDSGRQTALGCSESFPRGARVQSAPLHFSRTTADARPHWGRERNSRFHAERLHDQRFHLELSISRPSLHRTAAGVTPHWGVPKVAPTARFEVSRSAFTRPAFQSRAAVFWPVSSFFERAALAPPVASESRLRRLVVAMWTRAA